MEDVKGTFACPICGVDHPHWHSDEQVAAYRQDQIHQSDGWISATHRQPEGRGWYLCSHIEINRDQFGEKKDFWTPNERWSQLSWFLWVREGGTRGSWENEIPEVLFYDPHEGGWFLRNLLGNAVHSGAESRHAVHAEPRYWRDLPPIRKQASPFSSTSRATTDRNLAESRCEDCPAPRCIVCPVTSTDRDTKA